MFRKAWICFVLGYSLVNCPSVTPFLVHYENEYDKPLDFQCKDNTTLQYLSSHHDSHAEDRIWSLSCHPAQGSITNCLWSGYVNNFHDPVLFECSGNSFINGIESVHDNRYEDRRWSFQCCEMRGYARSDCQFSGYVNKYDHDLTFTVPEGELIHGIISVHNNNYEDRIFNFETCKFSLQ